MPLWFLDSVLSWLREFSFVQNLQRIRIERLADLYVGEKLAFAILFAVCLIGSVAALNRFFAFQFAWPIPRKNVKTPKRKKGFGIKHLVMVFIALLPGGMVGMFGVYAIMGRENWRRDALMIVGSSIVPALLLMCARHESFPWPDVRDAIYFSGLVGLIFGLLQLWALIKLLREWWGEPEECVGWWPPLALCVQCALFAAALLRLLAE